MRLTSFNGYNDLVRFQQRTPFCFAARRQLPPNDIDYQRLRQQNPNLKVGHPDRVLYATDLDGSLVAWSKINQQPFWEPLNAMVQTVQSCRKNLLTEITTGRGLTDIKLVSRFLKGYPLDFLSVNNGRHLFVNHRQQPTSRWINTLTLDDEDPEWRSMVAEKFRWDQSLFNLTLYAQIKAMGFRPAPEVLKRFTPFPQAKLFYLKVPADQVEQKILAKTPLNRLLLLDFFEDSSEFALRLPVVSHPMQLHMKQMGLQLVQAVTQDLGTKGVTVDHDFWSYPHFFLGYFAPVGLTKASNKGLLLERYQLTNGVITSGDNKNDMALLEPPVFKALSGREVRNMPILSGNQLDIEALKRKNPGILHAPEHGFLAMPFTQHLFALKRTLSETKPRVRDQSQVQKENPL